MLQIKEGFRGERSVVLPPLVNKMQAEDPLASSLYITTIGYYPNAEHHFRERKEPIADNVLIYCMDGRGHYRLRGKEFDVNAHQYFILPAGEPHSYWSDDAAPWTIYWIHFRGAHSQYYSEGADVPQDVKPGITSRINDRNNIFEEIFFTINNGYNQENLRYASSLLHYYLGSMRFLQQFRHADQHEEKVSSDTIANVVIHYMKENIEMSLSLDAISDYVGYSVSHLSTIFKRETGMSPLHYFNNLKIERSCELLQYTDMQINQICYKVGIEDCYYFSRLFKKIKGMPPREYREKIKAKD